MDYKKILTVSAVMSAMLISNSLAYASDPVEVHPARTDIFAGTTDGTSVSKKVNKKSSKTSRVSRKCRTRVIVKRRDVIIKVVQVQPKPKIIPIDFNAIDLMIENNNFDDADKFLQIAVNQKNKNTILINTLQAISYAKQGKNEEAQSILDKISQKNFRNSNIHFAQGVIYYNLSNDVNYKANSATYRQKAQDEFNLAISLNKKNYEAYNALGVILLKNGEVENAQSAFNTALTINPKFSSAFDNLGTIEYSNGKMPDAQRYFLTANKYNPNNATALFHLAKVEDDYGSYDKAIEYINKAIKIKPNFAPNTNLLGEIYKHQGNEPAAINQFNKAILQDSQYVLPYYNLASVFEKRGDSEFSINELKSAIALNPKYTVLKLKLADLSVSTGKYDQAISNYTSLINDKDLKTQAVKGLANAYYDKAQSLASKASFGSNENLYQALDFLNEAIKNQPNDLELHLAKLKLTKLTGQEETTQELLKKIISTPAYDMGSKITKGEAYLTLNNYKLAQTTFNDAVNSATTVDDRLKLAEIFTYHKQYLPAKNVLENVLKTDSKNKQALNNLAYIEKCETYAQRSFNTGNYYLKKKVIPAAIEYYSHSIVLNPNNAQAHLILAKTYEKQKDYANALVNYQAYVGLAETKKGIRKIERKIRKLEKKSVQNL